MDREAAVRTTKNIIAGTNAGVAVTLVGHPFDTLKVRLQTQSVTRPTYTGLWDCCKKTLMWEGVGGFYKGVGSPLAGQMFFRATLFTSYYQIVSWLSTAGEPRLSRERYFVAGLATGAIVSLVESPIDLFKTQMQIQIMRAKAGHAVRYRHVFHAGMIIASEQGIRGVYQGLGATVIRNVPSFSCFFGFFEITRSVLTPAAGSVNDLRFPQLLVAGGVGGLMYWLVTYPTDVVKSSMQSDSIVKGERKYKGVLHCIRRLYAEEGGWRRFYRGYTPCLMRSIVANSVQFATMETSRQLLGL